MTPAGQVGIVPACPATAPARSDRGLLFAAAGALAALNALAPQLLAMLRAAGALATFSWLGGISAVIWFALYALLLLGLEGGAVPLRRGDPAVLAATAGASLLPVRFAAEAALLALGLVLFLGAAAGSRERRIAAVLLALTGPLLWGKLLLTLFAAPVLDLDARLVGLLLGSAPQGNMLHFAHGTGRFLIAAPCSSIHNVSLAVLLWTVAVALLGLRPDARLALFGGAAIVAMFALNIARLTAIGLYPGDFVFLHDGLGAALFGWAALLGAGAVVGLGANDALRRQR